VETISASSSAKKRVVTFSNPLESATVEPPLEEDIVAQLSNKEQAALEHVQLLVSFKSFCCYTLKLFNAFSDPDSTSSELYKRLLHGNGFY
jgi:hypothetical protein